MTEQQLTPAEIRLAQYGQRTSTWSTATYNNGTEKALHEIAVGLKEEVDRLRAERDELRGKFADAAASLAEQVLRYGQRQREHNADREELERLRTVLTEIRHLHKDSPMGPCPVCIDADAVAAGRDGLMPYPCPTGRLAGAQDCDPPSFRAVTCPGFEKEYQGVSDAKRRLANCKHCGQPRAAHSTTPAARSAAV